MSIDSLNTAKQQVSVEKKVPASQPIVQLWLELQNNPEQFNAALKMSGLTKNEFRAAMEKAILVAKKDPKEFQQAVGEAQSHVKDIVKEEEASGKPKDDIPLGKKVQAIMEKNSNALAEIEKKRNTVPLLRMMSDEEKPVNYYLWPLAAAAIVTAFFF